MDSQYITKTKEHIVNLCLQIYAKPIRSTFAQLRLGILPLRIETGRFTNIVDIYAGTGLFRNMRVAERICNICNDNLVEDEKHFLFTCSKYNTERTKLCMYCRRVIPMFDLFTDSEKLLYLMQNKQKTLAQYFNLIWPIRNNSEFVYHSLLKTFLLY